MSFGFWALVATGFAAFSAAGCGLLRRRVVAIPPLNVARAVRSHQFWIGIGFQIVLGLICFGVAAEELNVWAWNNVMSH